MKTPIFDYVNEYINEKTARFHMPGHKGVPGFLGVEPRDLTEIDGADELYLADGIILESEKIAGSFFNAETFYSTEGSSHTIKAMLALVLKWSKLKGDSRTLILAGRNAHKTLINACITLDIDVDWIMPKESDSYESCQISACELKEILGGYKAANRPLPRALYVTSPDYLGNILDIKGLSKVCHEYGLILCVDNAHGAYLRFLETSLHPIDLGADIVCDSAHKTLPVLTGGAYLHVGKAEGVGADVGSGVDAHGADADCTANAGATNADCTTGAVLSSDLIAARTFFKDNANSALALFGSTSPSYIILQSLDACNVYLENLGQTLVGVSAFVDKIKERFVSKGYSLMGTEPLKITLYFENKSGNELADLMYKIGVIPEYYDKKHIVCMVTSQNTINDMNRLVEFFDREDVRNIAGAGNEAISGDGSVGDDTADGSGLDGVGVGCAVGSGSVGASAVGGSKRIETPKRALSFKDAYFAPSEKVLIKDSVGRIMSEALLSCPPAVPLFMSGEVIDERILTNRDWLSDDTVSVVF
ncbi:MAG: PLP-dependent transferase [Lachnospiraceae bacterium]|nr:PLP-dependent transferase [Lachnospiraceae bacterium]